MQLRPVALGQPDDAAGHDHSAASRAGRGRGSSGKRSQTASKAACTPSGPERPFMRRNISVLAKNRQWIGKASSTAWSRS